MYLKNTGDLKMLSVDEFINKVIGVKWVDRACSFDEMDCWGLVILYYRHVIGVELTDIKGYKSKNGSIETEAIPESLRNWQPCHKHNNSVFLAYIGDIPRHVGVVIDNHALHANGNSIDGGQVQYNKLDAIERMYTKVEYYKHVDLS